MEGKEKRVEEKEVEKKGKGKKWFWEKPSLFLFDCVFCVFPFFPAPHHHHSTTHAHTHPPPTTQHDAMVRTITCKQSRVLCCLFWEWTARHTLHHPHPTLHHLTSCNTHQQPQHKQSSWCTRQTGDNSQ